jgi:ATP-dependent Clp protease ATP-binding subunit ClpC
MQFNFDLKNSEIFLALKRAKFPLFVFAEIFSSICLFLFILSLLLVFFAFFGQVSPNTAIRIPVLFLVLYLLFWNLHLFFKLKIKKPQYSESLSQVFANPENYNLANFLSLPVAEIILASMKFCKKRNMPVSSTALFYFLVKFNKDIGVVCLRLGLDPQKLQADIKNYLEKKQRADSTSEIFTKDFKDSIILALEFASQKKLESIGAREILCALSQNDIFFKQVMVQADLKPEDIKNITLWLDSIDNVLLRNKEFWSSENLARQQNFGRDWASGYTITLDQFSIDWRNIVSRWMFKEITSHKKQIESVETILARDNLSNALIVGDSGAGRKSIMEAIAQKCYLGQTLPELNGKRVVELDMVKLSAGIQNFEKLEAVLDKIFSEALYAGNVILAINNLDNFVNQQIQKPGAVDISGILSKYLSTPGFKFIGITNYEGLHKNIEQNPSFAQLLRKIEVPEITEQETILILQANLLEFEYKHKILISYPAIREIVNLTSRYMPSLPFPEKAMDILSEVAVYVQSKKETIVLPHHIAEIISQKTDIPIGKMEIKEKETLLNLENLIHQRIVNQEEAVRQISVAMRRARAGIGSKKRPMGTFLFLGPTGVGKTETSKALAQIYFGSEEKMIRLDMSEFQAISDIPRLLGAVSPVEMQGLLTTPVRESPFSLVLLDEIEKAHPNILNLFLQVLDEGYITDGQGRKVVFTNTIIICTSNAGADMIFKSAEMGKAVNKDQFLEALFEKNIFKPEFVNRFDATVIFSPLTKENLLDISQLTLQSLQKNLKEKEINFEITEHLKERIVALSYKPAYGAREMRRVVQDKVENVVAQALLEDKVKKGDRFQINSDTFEVILNPPAE